MKIPFSPTHLIHALYTPITSFQILCHYFYDEEQYNKYEIYMMGHLRGSPIVIDTE